jgi:hypothetical protein
MQISLIDAAELKRVAASRKAAVTRGPSRRDQRREQRGIARPLPN